ncbi:MAG: hypothetical protein Q9169_005601 [Polycauliona sp. 2 TL-2023]
MDRSNTTTQSALYGRPPNTDDDYWMVKAILFYAGLTDADPVNGLPIEQFPAYSDENRSGSIIAGISISIVLIVSITITRLVARKTIRTSSLGWDDAFISAAALATIAGMVHYTTSSLTKFSIIFFNARLTGSTSRRWSWIHRTCFIVVLAWLLTALFATYMACKPYGSVMDLIALGKSVPHASCNGNNAGIGLFLQIFHALSDWILLAVPIFILVRLKMSWRRKAQCIIPLTIGTLSAVGASKRVYDSYHPPSDETYYFASQLPWTLVDVVCGICVTSLPAINNLILNYLPRHFSQYWSGGDPGSSPTTRGSLFSSRGLMSSRNTNTDVSGRGTSRLPSSGTTGSNFDETKQIMVQRDIDLESMRTDGEHMDENADPGYLELDELSSRHRKGNSTFIIDT